MNITILTLFPHEMASYFNKGILAKAQSKQLFSVDFVNIRDFSNPPHYKVDDYPFGNRKGMLLRADILDRAIQSVDNYESCRIIYVCPKGTVFNQVVAESFSESKNLIFICGYYEGVDERLFDLHTIERFSLGQFVLTSGELPVMTMIDASVRCISGVLGNNDSYFEDSITSGLLEYPQYTIPRSYKENEVPGVILSGHHAKIAEWQRKQALKQTLFFNPSLLSTACLVEKDIEMISNIIEEETRCLL